MIPFENNDAVLKEIVWWDSENTKSWLRRGQVCHNPSDFIFVNLNP